jgi:hypothetical protein
MNRLVKMEFDLNKEARPPIGGAMSCSRFAARAALLSNISVERLAETTSGLAAH